MKNKIAITCSIITILASIILIIIRPDEEPRFELATILSYLGLLAFGVFLLAINLKNRKKNQDN